MTDQENEYQSIPVAVARAAVQASGELVGLKGPEYWQGTASVGLGSPWLPMFAPTDEKPYPEFARVTITRKGQEPREVVISWDEYAAELELNDPKWLATRKQKPMTIFGAEVERHAYRVAFADVLATLEMPLRIAADASGITPPMPWAATQSPITRGEADEVAAAGWDLPERDWLAEVQAVPDLVALNKLDDEARAAGALAKVDGLQQAVMNRMLDLTAKPKPAPAPRPAPKGKPKQRRRRPRPDEAA